MPLINPDLMFVVPPRPFSPEPTDEHFNLVEFCVVISGILSLTQGQQDSVLEHLTRHAGPEATYTHKAHLQANLTKIFFQLRNSTTASERVAIALRLHEDISACTAGFHNRVNEIASYAALPLSATSFLYEYRVSIVEACARSRTDDVHEYNRFFTLARNTGRGVRPLSDSDVFNGEINDRIIIAALNGAFEKKYQPFEILNALKAKLYQTLQLDNDYTGRRPVENGYTYGQYQGFLTQFRLFFSLPEEGVSLTDYCVIETDEANEAQSIVDIDWAKVNKKCFDFFVSNQYFLYPSTAINYFEQLLHPDTEMPLPPPTRALYPFIFNSENELIQLLNFFDFIEPSKKIQLMRYYLDHLSPQDKVSALEQILEKFENRDELLTQLAPYIPNQLIKYYFKRTDALRNNVLMRAIIYQHSLGFKLNLLNYLPADIQYDLMVSVNHSQNNLLMVAFAQKLAEIPALFTLIQAWSPESRATFLMQTNKFHANALMLCLTHMPELYPSFKLLLTDLDAEALGSLLHPQTLHPTTPPVTWDDEDEDEENDDDERLEENDDGSDTELYDENDEENDGASELDPLQDWIRVPQSALFFAICYSPHFVEDIIELLGALGQERKSTLIFDTLSHLIEAIDDVVIDPDTLLHALKPLLALPKLKASLLNDVREGLLTHALIELRSQAQDETQLEEINVCLLHLLPAPSPAQSSALVSNQGFFREGKGYMAEEPEPKRPKPSSNP